MKDEIIPMFKEVVAELNQELQQKYHDVSMKDGGWFFTQAETMQPSFELELDEERIPSISYGPFHIHKQGHGYMVDEEVYQKWGVDVGSKEFHILHAKAVFNMLIDEMGKMKF